MVAAVYIMLIADLKRLKGRGHGATGKYIVQEIALGNIFGEYRQGLAVGKANGYQTKINRGLADFFFI
ncbi:hypothetical protein SDC9_169996 [bioreactor metagenome]|uniref:Uncharacterized protein n=1 Tax=bioreactor metagenome TaxID=1076179 RepID=A0A645GFT3_9ZZZZ